MQLHSSAQAELLLIFQNHSGHRDEKKLLEALRNFTLSPYIRQQGTAVLVKTSSLLKECNEKRLPTHDIIAVKLHEGAVQRLVRFYEMFGGYTNDNKVKAEVAKLDFTIYQKKTTNDHVLVFTEDYMRVINGTNNI